MRLDRLGAEDVRILKLETGHIRGHTCKVLVLESADGRPLPSLAALREHIAARLDRAPRLRRRLVATPLGLAAPVWSDDPRFAVERHVQGVATPRPLARAELPDAVARLMAQRLDRAHPLWRIDVVPREGDALALVWRIHHCLADGATAARIGSDVLWSEQPDEDAPAPSSWRPEPCPNAAGLLALGLAGRVRARARRPPPAARDAASRRAATAAIRRELAPRARPSPLDRRAGPARRIAFVQAPLRRCHDAGKAIDPTVTVNDVVLAIVAGGLRSWLDRRHRPLEGIRAKVPVSLHDRERGGDGPANRDSYFFVDLPLAEPDPVRRLLAISREESERKRAHDADALHDIALRRTVAHWASSPRVFTLSVSNVRGPASDVYILGAKVSELYSVAEIAPHHALRIAVISAGGALFFGLCADREAVGDLDVLADGLRRATDELLEPAAPATPADAPMRAPA